METYHIFKKKKKSKSLWGTKRETDQQVDSLDPE